MGADQETASDFQLIAGTTRDLFDENETLTDLEAVIKTVCGTEAAVEPVGYIYGVSR